MSTQSLPRPRGVPVTSYPGSRWNGPLRPPFCTLDMAMIEELAIGASLRQAASMGGYASGGSARRRLQHLYEVTGMNNIASLVAWCFRHGYLT